VDGTRQRHETGRVLAGLLVCAGLIAVSFTLGRCSAPAEARGLPVEDSIDIGSTASRLGDAEVAISEAVGGHLATLTTTTTTHMTPRVMPAPNYDPGDGSRWDQLAQCESGGNWAYPPVAGGFSGGIMFHIGTWRANGGLDYAPDAYLATRDQQITVAERVLAISGWGAWPGCSRKFGWL